MQDYSTQVMARSPDKPFLPQVVGQTHPEGIFEARDKKVLLGKCTDRDISSVSMEVRADNAPKGQRLRDTHYAARF